MPPLPLFFATLASTLIFAPLLSFLPLDLMAPALVLSVQRMSLLRCLQLGIIAGFVTDLLSGNSQLGLYAFSYSAAVLLLYRYRHRLFHDTSWALPLMTAIFCGMLHLFSALLCSPQQIDLHWIFFHLILFTALNAFYAFILLYIPKRHSLATRSR